MFCIWPPAASARRSLLAREFVGYLGSLIGREKVHELRVWADAGAVSPGHAAHAGDHPDRGRSKRRSQRLAAIIRVAKSAVFMRR